LILTKTLIDFYPGELISYRGTVINEGSSVVEASLHAFLFLELTDYQLSGSL